METGNQSIVNLDFVVVSNPLGWDGDLLCLRRLRLYQRCF